MSSIRAGLPQGRLTMRSERGSLTAVQLLAVLLLAVFPTMAMLLPGDLVRLGGRYGWWTPLLAAAPATLLAWLAGVLGTRVGDSVSAALQGLGPVAGRALLFVEWLALGAYVVVTIRESGDISAATLISANVPVWILTVLSMLPAVLLVWVGPVVLGRTAALIAPVLVFMYVAVLAGALPAVHVVWALPLLPRNGRFAAWHPMLVTWVWEAEPLFLGAGLLHQVQASAQRTAGRTLALAVAASALLTALGTWTMVAAAGPQGVAAAALPVLEVVNRITIGSSVQHLQSVVLPIETMGVVIKVGVFLWLWCRLGQRLVRISTKVVLAIEAAVGTALAVGAFPNLLAVDRALYLLLAQLALPTLVAATFVGYGAALIRQGRRGE